MSTTETVTLIAAGIAALASIVNAAVLLQGGVDAELRLARRTALEPHVETLSECLHEIIACSVILEKKSNLSTPPDPDSMARWREKATKAKNTLKDLRPKIRFALFGMDEALRVLSRVPDWADHLRADQKRAKILIKRSNKLRYWTDRAIRTVFIDGNGPTSMQRLWAGYWAWRCRANFENRREKA